ncbi:hypothetical protein THRCLA_08482 [Thraustotheca clavata]|uniref:Ubiquitin-like domain-containing protein n=1 Tax=Thraustotheca clavata TaxID=74557 RepID=A0A1V9Z5L6_9STRA|nr:hypothetical protein THRCLA_08482 [Thraustotheca clavata]
MELDVTMFPSKIKIMVLCQIVDQSLVGKKDIGIETKPKAVATTEYRGENEEKRSDKIESCDGKLQNLQKPVDNFENCTHNFSETANNFKNCVPKCQNCEQKSKNCDQNCQMSQQYSQNMDKNAQNGDENATSLAVEEKRIKENKVIVGENQVLVVVVRGKERMEFAMEKNCTVENVKQRVEECTDVPLKLQRLLHKGKYPKDNVHIETLIVRNNVMFMLLYAEQQYINMDIAKSTIEMQREYQEYVQQLNSLESKIGRNFFDKTDMMLRIAHLLDQVEILENNLQIAIDTKSSPALIETHQATKQLLDQIQAIAANIRTRNE